MLFACSDACLLQLLLNVVLFVLSPLVVIVIGLLHEWWVNKLKQQYCPRCGRAATPAVMAAVVSMINPAG